MRRSRVIAVVLFAVTVPFGVACGSSDGSSPKNTPSTKKAATPSPAADDTGDTTQAAEWKTIITGDWSLDPGTESYTCVRQTIDDDMIVSAFDAINPLGTHHTLLTVGDPTRPDGVEDCTAADNYPLSIFGSGVGTNEFDFPKGVAVRVEKGKQLLLNLHLFNTGTDRLSGTSGTRAFPCIAGAHI